MKKMTLGNRILAMLLAFVMILTGIAPGIQCPGRESS